MEGYGGVEKRLFIVGRIKGENAVFERLSEIGECGLARSSKKAGSPRRYRNVTLLLGVLKARAEIDTEKAHSALFPHEYLCPMKNRPKPLINKGNIFF